MKPKYRTQGDSFIVENYNTASPFSSFFPALAGETGKPMWLFYTNRGQAVSSFGVNNKDGAMLEFLPANKAYQSTPALGFRTLVSIKGPDRSWYEPFSVAATQSHQTMMIRPYDLELEDRSPAGLETRVHYVGIPGEDQALLGRSVTFRNTSKKAMQIEFIDGLPRIVPYGMNDFMVKNMSRTIEAFAEVVNHKAHVPFFKLKIEPSDRPELQSLTGGFFAFGLDDGDLMPVTVDPSAIFGQDTSFAAPHPESSDSDQLTSNIMPSAMFSARFNLAPGQQRSWTFYFGFASKLDFATALAAKVRENGHYFASKRTEMKNLFESLVGRMGFKTASEQLNNYANVTFMDNVLRGGYPLSFGANGPILHLYSRKHGDMERDYNAFEISATYYSQGNGNFRDVNQNRRHDLYLNPAVGVTNLEFFFNLLQLDGYNPLVINPVKFMVPRDVLAQPGLKVTEECRQDFHLLRRQPILAGELYDFVRKYSGDPLNTNNTFHDIIKSCTAHYGIQHGEGFWVDHWIYNLDHLDQYLAVNPEKLTWLLYEKNDFTWFDSDHFVKPRREKYVITKEGKLRQYGAVTKNPAKLDLIQSRGTEPWVVRTDGGKGDVLHTTLFVKLLALVAVKTSTLDPYGVGLEMEADKPGWCDALNGLPGLFGSSTHEMYELHRLVRFLIQQGIPAANHKTIEIPQEILGLVRDVEAALGLVQGKDFRVVWDKLATARETYREKVFFGVSGKTRPHRMVEIERFLKKISTVLYDAQAKAIDPKTQIPTSYFVYEIEPATLANGWRQYLHKLEWKQKRLVPFLEGAVHALKMMPQPTAKKLYRAVKKSALSDAKLGMYKLNVSLANESPEIGRIHVFSAGWLENESIFLHMHYKYLLEVLKAGLIDEFFEECKDGIVAFFDAEVYGRPTSENSSFIASSAFPKKEMHGKGFVARLSGATSEFMSMVYMLVYGKTPFELIDGGVVFAPEPTLPAEWFSRTEQNGLPKHALALRLFGVPLTFLNPQMKKTYGAGSVKPSKFEWILDGRFHEHEGRFLPVEASQALREGRLETLTVVLGRG